MRAAALRTVPGHPDEQQRHSTGAGKAGEEKSAAEKERQEGKPRTQGKSEDRAGGGKRAGDNLNLPHDRDHRACAAVYRKAGVDPGLGPPLDQDAIATSGEFELFDGAGRPRPGVAKEVNRCIQLVLKKKVIDLQFVERNQSCTWNMRRDIFWIRANIQQLMRVSGAEKCSELGRRN